MSESRYPLHRKKLVFLDLDGTVYLGDAALPGARPFLRYLREHNIRHYFLSNNSSRSKQAYVDKLRGMDIPAEVEQVLLSTDGLIAWLRRMGADKVHAVGTRSMLEMLREHGIDVDSDDPAYVVLGFDTELTYDKLRRASLLMQKGIDLLATHPDLVCPTPEGPIPDVGAMLALLKKATGKTAVKVFGKPNQEMVSHLLERYGIPAGDAVMIGDRLYTDMELARRLGCDSILVLSGESRRSDLAAAEWRPTLVVENLGEILG